jgi:hypothetical protein
MSKPTDAPASSPEVRPGNRGCPPAKSLDDLMAEQGITGPPDLDTLIGAGADLWTDAEFEEFQRWLRESRREGR